MLNRRTFIQAGALAALPFAANAGFSAEKAGVLPAADTPVSLYTVVFDTRFAAAVRFGEEAGRLGLATSTIRGDVTDLWYHNLYHRWRAGPAAIAGMTTPDALFCLETLGNDAGLRLVMRAEHRVGAAGVEHTLLAPQAVLRQAGLEQCGDHWSAHMAQLLGACPATRAGRMETSVVTPAARAAETEQPLLVSWVLAPLSRRAALFT